jgi:hypothetical protein
MSYDKAAIGRAENNFSGKMFPIIPQGKTALAAPAIQGRTHTSQDLP